MNGKVVIGTELDTKSFDAQIAQVERKLELLEKSADETNIPEEFRRSADEAKDLNAEIERTRNKLTELYKKQNEINMSGFNGIKESIANVGSSMENAIKKVSKWALAVFGVRSAYMFVRNAINTIASEDDQLSADINFMKTALAYVIEPVVRRIVDLARQLMSYIAYIVKAWTGRDIFASASKSIGKATSGAKALNKELNKTLAGFDEMNVAQDSSSSGGGAGGGGGAGLSDFGIYEPPGWVKWIAENKDLVLSILAGITAGVLALHAGLTAIQALGIGVAVAGVVYAIQKLIDYLNDPSWENFGGILQGIGVAMVGLALITSNFGLGVIGVIVLIVATIIKYWDEIKAFLQNGIDWLKGKSDWVHQMFGDTIGNIYDFFVGTLQGILNWFDLTFTSIKGIFDGIIKFVKGVFSGDWKLAWEGIKQIFGNIWNWIKGTAKTILNNLINTAITIASTIGDVVSGVFKAVVNGILWAIENILNFPIKAVNKLIDVINAIPGIDLGKLPTFELPRLRKGGIINMPGRGVAIGGEAGREGVIPLTDSQQMELLGETIGKYITINANITNSMNGRIISRELQKIQNESNFAYNR